MSLNFSETEVKDGSTILVISPESRREYVPFFELFELTKKHENYHLRGYVIDYFKDLIGEYTRRFGFQIPGKDDRSNAYLNDNTIRLICGKRKIIPGREEYLDGYVINLEFGLGPAVLLANSILTREGKGDLTILEDFLKLKYKKNGDGIKRPRLHFDSSQNGGICVSSIEHTFRVLEELEKLYQSIGNDRFEELSELLESSRGLKGPVSKKLLEDEYNKRVGLLLPRNLD